MNIDIKKILVMVLLMVTLVSCTDKNENTENEVSENNFIEQEAKLDVNVEPNNDMDSHNMPEHNEMNTNIVDDVTVSDIFSLYNYVKYSKEDIEKATKMNVLFFNDSMSEGIKTLKSNLLNTKIHDWLVMYEIDFNTDVELKEKYSVTSAHTFVQVDNMWTIIRKWEWSESIWEMHVALTSEKTLVK